MRRSRLGGMAAALIVGLGAITTTRGDDYQGKAPPSKGLLSSLFAEKPRAKAKTDAKSVEDKATSTAAVVESAHALQQRYQNALLRRMEVCDRLQFIADETGDEELRNRAYQLQERANEIFRLQMASLPLPAPRSTVVPNENAGNVLAREGEESTASPRRRPLSGEGKSKVGGGMDRSEQAILNGTNMGGNNR
jgi:hypothetical protein